MGNPRVGRDRPIPPFAAAAARRSAAAALAAGALLLSACAGSAARAAAPPDGLDVTGHRYVATSVTGERTHPLVAGTRFELRFTSDAVSAQAGCNSMGGTVHRVGNRVTVPELASTAMGCPSELLAQDRWINDLLAGGIDLGGTSERLTVTGQGARLTFEPAPTSS